ncbi:MAG: 5-formyltetrahydrofolate cyclo-ligase [Bdellovibrionota bacterium]
MLDGRKLLSRAFKNIPGPPPATKEDRFDPQTASKTLIIVPGLAFDRLGNWIGRSFGYYNKFLASQQMKKSIKIGVGWSLQLIDHAPADPYDIYLDYICTEDEIISTSEPIPAISLNIPGAFENAE